MVDGGRGQAATDGTRSLPAPLGEAGTVLRERVEGETFGREMWFGRETDRLCLKGCTKCPVSVLRESVACVPR